MNAMPEPGMGSETGGAVEMGETTES
jgi:hypothetical protein